MVKYDGKCDCNIWLKMQYARGFQRAKQNIRIFTGEWVWDVWSDEYLIEELRDSHTREVNIQVILGPILPVVQNDGFIYSGLAELAVEGTIDMRRRPNLCNGRYYMIVDESTVLRHSARMRGIGFGLVDSANIEEWINRFDSSFIKAKAFKPENISTEFVIKTANEICALHDYLSIKHPKLACSRIGLGKIQQLEEDFNQERSQRLKKLQKAVQLTQDRITLLSR